MNRIWEPLHSIIIHLNGNRMTCTSKKQTKNKTTKTCYFIMPVISSLFLRFLHEFEYSFYNIIRLVRYALLAIINGDVINRSISCVTASSYPLEGQLQ